MSLTKLIAISVIILGTVTASKIDKQLLSTMVKQVFPESLDQLSTDFSTTTNLIDDKLVALSNEQDAACARGKVSVRCQMITDQIKSYQQINLNIKSNTGWLVEP